MVNMIPVESSNIVAICYDSDDKALYVKYSTNTYKYDDVPKEIAYKFLTADSKGRFMNDYIKGSYHCTKLNLH